MNSCHVALLTTIISTIAANTSELNPRDGYCPLVTYEDAGLEYKCVATGDQIKYMVWCWSPRTWFKCLHIETARADHCGWYSVVSETQHFECCPGYKKTNGNNCQPECEPPCDVGRCVAPGTCSCFHGYQGEICSIPDDSPQSIVCSLFNSLTSSENTKAGCLNDLNSSLDIITTEQFSSMVKTVPLAQHQLTRANFYCISCGLMAAVVIIIAQATVIVMQTRARTRLEKYHDQLTGQISRSLTDINVSPVMAGKATDSDLDEIIGQDEHYPTLAVINPFQVPSRFNIERKYNRRNSGSRQCMGDLPRPDSVDTLTANPGDSEDIGSEIELLKTGDETDQKELFTKRAAPIDDIGAAAVTESSICSLTDLSATNSSQLDLSNSSHLKEGAVNNGMPDFEAPAGSSIFEMEPRLNAAEMLYREEMIRSFKDKVNFWRGHTNSEDNSPRSTRSLNSSIRSINEI